MRRGTSDRLALGGYIASIAVICVVYGTVSSWWGWFPAPQLGLAHRTMLELKANWRNDLALEPTRHLVAPDDSGAAPDPDRGFALLAPERVAPGYVLVAGLSDDQETSVHVVRLFDAAGDELHRWPIRYGLLDTERKPQNVMLHGMEVFPDGSLVVTFDSGSAVARIDACGEPMWSRSGKYHHSMTNDGQGRLLTWRDEVVVWLDPETGEEVHTLDLKTIINAQDGLQQGYFDIRTRTPEIAGRDLAYLEDPFHPNDAEALTPAMADAFPMFKAGDVLISLRELNLIAVVDPEDGTMKWWRHGPWMKQHDPDFQPDGTITVFDNGTGTGGSKIRRIDPADDSLSVDYAGSTNAPFYTWRRGKHQILPNGNLLLTEAEHGRVFEAAPDGEIVWDRHMAWDAELNLIVTEARHVDPDFFDGGPPTCVTEISSDAPDAAPSL